MSTPRRTYRTADGKKLPSVTEILSILNKPALVPWAAKVAAQEAAERTAAGIVDGGMPPDRAIAWGAKCGRAKPGQSSRRAADRGTLAHGFVEAWAKGQLGEECVVDGLDAMDSAEVDAARVCADAVIARLTADGYEVVDAEPMISSERLGYGGTPDLILRLDGQLILADLKTGKGVYREVLMQLAGYSGLLCAEPEQWRSPKTMPKTITYAVIHAPAFASRPVVNVELVSDIDGPLCAWAAVAMASAALAMLQPFKMTYIESKDAKDAGGW